MNETTTQNNWLVFLRQREWIIKNCEPVGKSQSDFVREIIDIGIEAYEEAEREEQFKHSDVNERFNEEHDETDHAQEELDKNAD